MSAKKQVKPTKPNAERIIKALEEWSPNGLCTGTMIARNGRKENTIGCTVGALMLGLPDRVLPFPLKDLGPESKTNAIKHGVFYYKTATATKVHDGTDGQTTAFEKYYGLSEEDTSNLIKYNDVCDGQGYKQDLKDSLPETAPGIPRKVLQTISRLRQRYERLMDTGKLQY
jgi:hypothetical protein